MRALVRVERCLLDLGCLVRGHRWAWWRGGWAMYCTRCGKSWHPVDPPTLDDVRAFAADGA